MTWWRHRDVMTLQWRDDIIVTSWCQVTWYQLHHVTYDVIDHMIYDVIADVICDDVTWRHTHDDVSDDVIHHHRCTTSLLGAPYVLLTFPHPFLLNYNIVPFFISSFIFLLLENEREFSSLQTWILTNAALRHFYNRGNMIYCPMYSPFCLAVTLHYQLLCSFNLQFLTLHPLK